MDAASAAAEPFLSFSRSSLAVVQKVLWWIIRLAPIATVGLLGNAVVAYGWETWGRWAGSAPRSTWVSCWPATPEPAARPERRTEPAAGSTAENDLVVRS